MPKKDQKNDPLAEALKKAKAQSKGDSDLATKLQETEDKLQAMTEMAQRASADLQNFKRRAEEERASIILFANKKLLDAIFPTIDNFQRAAKSVPENLKDDNWTQGILAVEKQFVDTLKGLGLEEIPALGQPLDPNLHEALMAGPGEKDIIIEEFEKGYTFGGKVVRPSKVKVGDGN